MNEPVVAEMRRMRERLCDEMRRMRERLCHEMRRAYIEVRPILPGDAVQRVGESGSEKADGLLRERLGKTGWRLFQQTGKLMRPSRLWPGIEYLVARGQRVKVVQRGKIINELCAQTRASEPEADRLMTILDLLETDERRLWEMANLVPSGSLQAAPPTAAPPTGQAMRERVASGGPQMVDRWAEVQLGAQAWRELATADVAAQAAARAPGPPLAGVVGVRGWRRVFDPSQMPFWWYVTSLLSAIAFGASVIRWLGR